jgi:hypothetical protein
MDVIGPTLRVTDDDHRLLGVEILQGHVQGLLGGERSNTNEETRPNLLIDQKVLCLKFDEANLL